VPIHGSLGVLALATVAYLFVLLATGVFISSIASTQQQANEMAQALFIPAFFLSGFMFPRAGLPWPLAWLGLAFPATHMMEIMRGVIVRGAGLAELWPHCAILVAMAFALWWLASRRVQSFMWR
jgi:ABC-2 type transport system permease protein